MELVIGFHIHVFLTADFFFLELIVVNKWYIVVFVIGVPSMGESQRLTELIGWHWMIMDHSI